MLSRTVNRTARMPQRLRKIFTPGNFLKYVFLRTLFQRWDFSHNLKVLFKTVNRCLPAAAGIGMPGRFTGSVFERSGVRFALRKRVKTKKLEPYRFQFHQNR